MMQGKLRVRGDLPTILRYVQAADELVRSAARCRPEFPDEAPTAGGRLRGPGRVAWPTCPNRPWRSPPTRRSGDARVDLRVRPALPAREDPIAPGEVLGHEAVGVVEAVGRVRAVRDPATGSWSRSTSPAARAGSASAGRPKLCEDVAVLAPGRSAATCPAPRRSACGCRGGREPAGVPAGVDDERALFVGDVLTTGFYAASLAGAAPATSSPCSGAGRWAAARAALRALGVARVFALDREPTRLALADAAGADPVDVGERQRRERAGRGHRRPRRRRRDRRRRAGPCVSVGDRPSSAGADGRGRRASTRGSRSSCSSASLGAGADLRFTGICPVHPGGSGRWPGRGRLARSPAADQSPPPARRCAARATNSSTAGEATKVVLDAVSVVTVARRTEPSGLAAMRGRSDRAEPGARSRRRAAPAPVGRRARGARRRCRGDGAAVARRAFVVDGVAPSAPPGRRRRSDGCSPSPPRRCGSGCPIRFSPEGRAVLADVRGPRAGARDAAASAAARAPHDAACRCMSRTGAAVTRHRRARRVAAMRRASSARRRGCPRSRCSASCGHHAGRIRGGRRAREPAGPPVSDPRRRLGPAAHGLGPARRPARWTTGRSSGSPVGAAPSSWSPGAIRRRRRRAGGRGPRRACSTSRSTSSRSPSSSTPVVARRRHDGQSASRSWASTRSGARSRERSRPSSSPDGHGVVFVGLAPRARWRSSTATCTR